MGAAGAGSLGQVVNAAIANKARMEHMREFFEGVGTGDTAGIWEGDRRTCAPTSAPSHQKKLDKAREGRQGGGDDLMLVRTTTARADTGGRSTPSAPSRACRS